MIETQQSHNQARAVARALIAAMRCFAANTRDGTRLRRDQALRALCPTLPLPLAIDSLPELAEIVAEISALRPASTVWAAPDQAALQATELRLIRIMATLQQSDVATALASLTGVLGRSRIGGALFPIKSLAARLARAGVAVGAIGERKFGVIVGGEIVLPQPAERRTEVKRAR